MKGFHIGALAVLAGVMLSGAWAARELRDATVLYLDENLPQAPLVALLGPADVFLGKDLQGLAASLSAGTKISVVGYHPEAWLVRFQKAGSTIEGWVAPDRIAVDVKLLEQATAHKAQREQIEEAIKEKRILEGMTFEDVRKALGKPDKTSFRKDQNGRIDNWNFITYDRIPQYDYRRDAFGRFVRYTYYIKVPVGDLLVEFQDGRVIAFEEHRQERPR
jgi:hypothetical protein